MPEETLLIGMSQLGATFAGFVAIFLIFIRKDGRFPAAEALRIRALIYTSLLVVVTGVAPVGMAFVVGSDDVWQVSALIALGFGLLSIAHIMRRHAAMTKEERREIVVLHATVTYGLAMAAAAIVAALGFGWIAGSGWYVVAVMLTLLNVIVTFITLAFKNLF